jgi:hypothetical protein
MKELSQIAENIRNIAKPEMCSLHIAEVKAVDADTCTIDIGGIEIEGVRLTSVVSDSQTKLTITPAAGSRVIVADISNGRMTDFAVIQYAEIESMTFTIGNTAIAINADGVSVNADAITINNGDNGGIPIVQKIQSNFDKIKNYLDQLNMVIASSINAVGTSTSASGSVGASTFNANKPTLAQWDNMEDSLITH